MTAPYRLVGARWWIAALGVTVVLAIYGVTLAAPSVGFYHDDGIYVVTAKALAEGRGYTIISLPDEIPQTKYPILFPLGLALIWTVAPSFPANLLYLKLLPFAGALLWLWVADRLLVYQTDRPGLSHGIVILTAISPSVVRYSTILLAESLFAGLAWSGLWVLARCEREPATGPRLVSASLLCAAAYHTRTVGFTLIAAGIVGLAIKKKFRAAVVFGVVSSFVCRRDLDLLRRG